jgi:hypothetical protein
LSKDCKKVKIKVGQEWPVVPPSFLATLPGLERREIWHPVLEKRKEKTGSPPVFLKTDG